MKKTYNRPIVKTVQVNCSQLISASLLLGGSNSGDAMANSNGSRDEWSDWDEDDE